MQEKFLKIPLHKNTDSNLLERFRLLRQIVSTIIPEYRLKWPQMAWWSDSEFNQYLEKFGEINMPNTDRRFNLQQLLQLSYSVRGDSVEVGAYQGAMSYLICKYNAKYVPERIHHIFDSFEGLSNPNSKVDGSHWSPGSLSCPESNVIQNLSDFEGTFCTYKGWVPEKFKFVESKVFSFVHIDVDLYEPTLQTLEFFYSRLSSGGLIVCDDYGFTSCPGATKACDEFTKDKDESFIGMADGGGFLIKGIKTNKDLPTKLI